MHASAKSSTASTLAKTVAPEDIARGDYVALLSVDYEFPLLAWLYDPPSTQHDEVVRVRRRADLDSDPLRVREICLPFVFARKPSGEHVTLDLRHCELARLDPVYGQRVCKALAPRKKLRRAGKPNRKRRHRKK